MIALAKWVDRTFEFNFTVAVFPAILERLRGTPARIEELVERLPQDILNRRIDHHWSIQENIGHLLVLDPLHDGRIDDYLSGKEVLRGADMKNMTTHESDFNVQPIDNVLAEFRKGRMSFVHRLEQVTESQAAKIAVHPRLQISMRLVDMAYFTAEHDDHHIAKATAIAKQLLK